MHFAEGDSKNYLTYYKRAAVFLAMGKSKSALPDLTKAIQLKPDFLAVSSRDRSQNGQRSSENGFIFLLCPRAHISFVLSFVPLFLSSRLVTLRAQARLQRGNILLKQGNTQEAMEDFEAVVSLSRKTSSVLPLSVQNSAFD